MAAVDQLVGNAVLYCFVLDASQIELVAEASHYNQPLRSNFQHFFTTNLGSSVPVSQRVAICPSCIDPVGLSELISEIDADNQRVVLVPPGEFLRALEEHVFRVLIGPPEPISVIVGAAPLGSACVVVEDNHDPLFC